MSQNKKEHGQKEKTRDVRRTNYSNKRKKLKAQLEGDKNGTSVDDIKTSEESLLPEKHLKFDRIKDAKKQNCNGETLIKKVDKKKVTQEVNKVNI